MLLDDLIMMLEALTKDKLYLVAIGATVTCLGVWRIVKFTLLPLLYPDDPKELPYWIPVVGHVVSFFKNSNHLLDDASAHFNNSKEPFAVTVAGSRLYILTNPKHVGETYKNTSTLSFEEFVRDMMRTSGSSEFVIKKMYETPDPAKAIFPNPRMKPLAKMAKDLHVHQLYSGKPLDVLREEFYRFYDNSMKLKHMSTFSYAINFTPTEVVLPLYIWTSDVIISAGQDAYFGPLLAEVAPHLTWDFLEFDDLTWQLLYQYPKFLAKKMYSARDRVVNGLEKYFTEAQKTRGVRSWFTPAMENEMRNLQFDTHEVAIMMMTIYWGINTNTRRSCFWMLTYMLFDSKLVDIVREETRGAFQEGGEYPDIKYLEEKCPNLNAIWHETIRLSAYSSSVRYITQDTRIGGKILRKGHRVMLPNRQLHFDKKVFGEDVHKFRHTRFLDEESLVRTASWRPFGGGITLCPGRFIAKQAVIGFIAMTLQRFDIELVGEKKSPRMEDGSPVLGIMSRHAEDDVPVRLRPRKANA